MHVLSDRYVILIAAAVLLFSPQARAETCHAAATLAQIHDAYTALDLETGQLREDAAIALLALYLPAAVPETLAKDLSGEDLIVPQDQLAMALSAAASRAREVIEGQAVSGGNQRHELNRYWLSGVIFATGCPAIWETNAYRSVDRPRRKDDTPVIAQMLQTRTPTALGIAAAILAAAAGTVLIRRSRLFRRRELRRLPRIPVSLPATVILDDESEIPVRTLDLSQGGAKIAWEKARNEATPLVLVLRKRRFPASVIWRNAYYAGLLFDSQLTKPELDDLLSPAVSDE